MAPKKAKKAPAKIPSMLAREKAKSAAKPKAPATGFAKAGAKPAAGAKKPAAKAAAKPAAPKWTPEDDAARRIQCIVRMFLAKKKLVKMRAEKAEWDKQMEELENEAWLAEMAYEKRQAEKRATKMEEERARKKRDLKLRSQLLEGAFDGELGEMKAALSEGCDVDVQDGNGNTALSEAAVSGQLEACKLLVENGCDPNTQGQFKRTPLWRSCFSGHLEVAKFLLQNGADPRIGDVEGGMPRAIATVSTIKEFLDDWDISTTDAIMQDIAAKQESKRQKAQEERDAAKAGLQDVYDQAKEEHDTLQKRLKNAYSEWNKRIMEYDTCIQEGKGGMDIMHAVKKSIEDAEEHLNEVKEEAAEATERFNSVKGDLHTFEQENADEEELPGVKIVMKILADVLFKDVGGGRAKDGRWPLVVDPSRRATMFVRYRDNNYLNACSSKDMAPAIIRKAILGSLKYGKPLVVDMMDVDIMDTVVSCFDALEKGLWEKIMSKSLLKDEAYKTLITKEDLPEYTLNNIQEDKVNQFMLIVITYQRRPPDELMDKHYCIHVKGQDDGF